MRKIYNLIIAFVLAIAVQTLNVVSGNVTYQFPAEKAGEMNYASGTTLTIMDKTFTMNDITKMYVDASEVTDNNVRITYNGTTASVNIAGNIAAYVNASVNGGHVSISQTNTADIDGDEITYILKGNTSDGSLTLDGSYKCTVQLAGLTMTNPSGAAITINNKKIKYFEFISSFI